MSLYISQVKKIKSLQVSSYLFVFFFWGGGGCWQNYIMSCRLPAVLTYLTVDLLTYVTCSTYLARDIYIRHFGPYIHMIFFLWLPKFYSSKRMLLTIIMQIYSIVNDFSLPNFSYVLLRMLTYVYLCTCFIGTSLIGDYFPNQDKRGNSYCRTCYDKAVCITSQSLL